MNKLLERAWRRRPDFRAALRYAKRLLALLQRLLADAWRGRFGLRGALRQVKRLRALLPALAAGHWPGRLASLALWLAVGGLALFAGTQAGVRYLICSLDQRQPWIETLLAERGLSEVSLGEVTVSCSGRDPVLQTAGLSFKAEGRPVLEIDSARLRVDWLASLAGFTLVASELEVAGLRFALAERDGRLALRGWPGLGAGVSLNYALDVVFNLDQFHAEGVDIDIAYGDVAFGIRTDGSEPLRIHTADGQRQLRLSPILTPSDVPVDEKLQPQGEVSLTGHYSGDPRDSSFAAQLFVKFLSLDPASLLPNRVRESPLALAGELLLEAAQGQAKAVASIEFSAVDFSYQLQGIRLALAGSPFLPAEAELVAALPSLNLAELGALATRLAGTGLLPERAGAAIAGINLQGTAKDVLLRSKADATGARLVADIEKAAITGYLGAPSLTDINGFLSVGLQGGYIDLDNPEPFELHLPRLFEQPWPFSSGKGRVSYAILPNSYLVTTGLAAFQNGDSGAFMKLRLDFDQAPEYRTWAMALGITEVPLTTTHLYLPDTLGPRGREWIGGRLEAGTGVENGLLMHGALDRNAPWEHKTLGGYFKVRDTRLRYHDDWPPVEGLSATVSMTSQWVGSRDAVGRVLDSEVTEGGFHLPIADRQVHQVQVKAQSQGPLPDAIQLLSDTPLAEMTGRFARSWTGSGEVSASLDLTVPISGTAPELAVEVNADFAGIGLSMRNYNLHMSALEGSLRYTDTKGLESPGLQGMLFGKPVAGWIESRAAGRAGETVVHLTGSIEMPDLHAWTGQPLLSQSFGVADYVAAVHIPYGGRKNLAYVDVESQLVGATLILPAPLTKLHPNTALPVRYRQTFAADGHLVDLRLLDRMHASFKVRDGLMLGGRFHLGSTPPLATTYDDVQVTGHLERLRYSEWANVVRIVTGVAGSEFDANLRHRFGALQLSVDELALFGSTFRTLELAAVREPGRWVASVSNDALTGTLALPDDAPLQLVFDYLRIPSAGNEDGRDPLGRFNPLSIGDLDFSADSFIVGEEDLGSWAFEYQVQDDKAVIGSLQADTKGIRIVADSMVEWRSPEEPHDDNGVLYHDRSHQSRFQGRVQIADVGAALAEFGLASSIEGQEFDIEADLQWAGSPAVFDFMQTQGAVRLLDGKGRFVQAEGGGALKLLGIFNFAQLARRFRLDFDDVIKKGYEFNEITGVAKVDKGELEVTEPLLIDSTTATLKIGGSASLNARTLDADMVVTLPLNKTLPWYAAYSAIVTGPLAGAGVLLAREMFRDQFDSMSSAKYSINGTIDDPEIKFVAIFDASVSTPGNDADEPLPPPRGSSPNE